jgi:hypothetical protein
VCWRGATGTAAAVLTALITSEAVAALDAGPARDLADARIDPVIAETDGARLGVAGTAGGSPIRTHGSLFADPPVVVGSITSEPVAAVMTGNYQAEDGARYVPTARLTASGGDAAMVLTGAFHLDAEFAFTDGTVRDALGGRPGCCRSPGPGQRRTLRRDLRRRPSRAHRPRAGRARVGGVGDRHRWPEDASTSTYAPSGTGRA